MKVICYDFCKSNKIATSHSSKLSIETLYFVNGIKNEYKAYKMLSWKHIASIFSNIGLE